MRTLDLSRPKIWRGRRPPKLCRPGRVKCKLESPCSVPRAANMFTRGVPKAENNLSKVS